MIIPTPDFDPLFADDGVPFRTKMIQYIEREFGDVLGARRRLLQSECGLDALSENINRQLRGDGSQNAA